MELYNKFASVYDTVGADRFSERMVAYCKRIFDHHNIKPTKGIDLCCGTGTAVELLAKIGIEMSGLDRSKPMLKIAKAKLKKYSTPLYNLSLPSFRITEKNSRKLIKYDLATCFFDSLNYLKNERELKRAFGSVNRHLEDGGWFIFDMNTPESLKTLWDENIYAGEKENVSWIWYNYYDPKLRKATCRAVFFKKKGRLWERFEETHHERAYSHTIIKKMLRESGFAVAGYYNCLTFETPTILCDRICVVAKKK